jgi:PPOX class probable F420-dependent enzyme
MTFDATTPAGIRALERLATEKIGWLTTVAPDGQPQASAIWFLWEDGEVLIYSHKRAPRNGNIEDNPKVAFNLHTDAGGGDYLSMEGTARFEPEHPVSSQVPAYQAKYGAWIEDYGWTPQWFDGEYPVVLRITPTRWRFG